jgi:fluoride exporter
MTDHGHGDALERTAVPRLGLSAAVLVAIALGGALGTVARFLLDTTFSDSPTHFPTTTLLINLSGSLLIGLLVPLVDNFSTRAQLVRPFLIVGVLGGWTTYSTLTVDAVVLAKDGHAVAGVLSLAATLVGGLALVVCGNALGRRAIDHGSPGHNAPGYRSPGHKTPGHGAHDRGTPEHRTDGN